MQKVLLNRLCVCVCVCVSVCVCNCAHVRACNSHEKWKRVSSQLLFWYVVSMGFHSFIGLVKYGWACQKQYHAHNIIVPVEEWLHHSTCLWSQTWVLWQHKMKNRYVLGFQLRNVSLKSKPFRVPVPSLGYCTLLGSMSVCDCIFSAWERILTQF